MACQAQSGPCMRGALHQPCRATSNKRAELSVPICMYDVLAKICASFVSPVSKGSLNVDSLCAIVLSMCVHSAAGLIQHS